MPILRRSKPDVTPPQRPKLQAPSHMLEKTRLDVKLWGELTTGLASTVVLEEQNENGTVKHTLTGAEFSSAVLVSAPNSGPLPEPLSTHVSKCWA